MIMYYIITFESVGATNPVTTHTTIDEMKQYKFKRVINGKKKVLMRFSMTSQELCASVAARVYIIRRGTLNIP